MLVKGWSIAGQMLVSPPLPPPAFRRNRSPDPHRAGQMLVKCWSNAGLAPTPPHPTRSICGTSPITNEAANGASTPTKFTPDLHLIYIDYNGCTCQTGQVCPPNCRDSWVNVLAESLTGSAPGWSISGQLLVNCWSIAGPASLSPDPHQAGQLLVKCWSITAQMLVEHSSHRIRTDAKLGARRGARPRSPAGGPSGSGERPAGGRALGRRSGDSPALARRLPRGE
jgi:hypothetical protein